MINELEKAPRRSFNPKRVGKIGEKKEILRVKEKCSFIKRFHSLKEAEKNFEGGYYLFCGVFNLGQGSILRQ